MPRATTDTDTDPTAPEHSDFPPPAKEPRSEMFDPAEALSGYERSPEDLLRLLVSVTIAAVVVLFSKLLVQAVSDLQTDVVGLLAVSSPDAVRLLEGLLSLIGTLLAILTLVLPLVTRRFRTFGYVLVSLVSCTLVMAAVDGWIGIDGSTNAIAVGGGISTDLLPDAASIAATAAAIVVFGTFVTRRWRQVLWSLFAAMLVLQLVVSVHPPLSTVVALTVGPAVASTVLLVFGRPTSRPTLAAIRSSLSSAGLEVAEIRPAAVDARGSTPYFATARDGTPLFVKVLGANERAADLLFRLYRRLRLRNVGDERPDSSLRRTVEHEALVSLQARDVGVATPRMRAVGRVGQDSFLLSYDLIPGSSLDGVDPDAFDDAVLTDLWQEVAGLRRHRIAHRDLRLANVFLGDDGAVWIIDFGFAEVAADDELLNADVAQLLASLAVVVGADRAAESGVACLGPDAIASAVPRLQMVALSGATQSALKECPGLLEDLRATLISRCNIDPPELDPLNRFRPSHGLLLTASALALFVGLPLLAGPQAVGDVLAGADWASTGWLVALAAVIAVAHSWGLYSSAPVTLPAWPTLAATFASVFASTTAPASLGGSSLRVRYLERHGLPPQPSAAATAFNGLVQTAAAAALLVAFLLWAGRHAFESVVVERPEALWGGLAVLAVLSVATLAVPGVRRRVHEAAVAHAGLVREGFRQLSGSPSRVATTAAAAVVMLLASAVALDTALRLMGSDVAFGTLGVIFLAGWLLASMVPTPGHLGAVEVVLVAGLVGAGVEGSSAVCAVLLYRLATFWLPVLIGWPAFGWLVRQGHV